ncbi:MAG: peptide MFS transporter [Planctomycetes bacterium]|nr:peptide MFS transporter [Planctomycetota bacterium]
MSTDLTLPQGSTSTRLGHPSGLFLLFFVEMWERFSYYGMRALLVFYMTKGFLKLDDASAYAIYGAYTALVYATPFLGGMLADRLLGTRRAVILGGMLMAAGHLLMTFEDKTAFSVALALLICGNGFFKPNISTMVGGLYPQGSPLRDSGFTIFYMGINLGAAMSPLICGYVGETFGWHYGFGLATIGMLTGLMTFVADRKLSQILILLTAIATSGSMVWFHYGDPMQLMVNAPVGIALLVAAFIAVAALAGGGLPAHVGLARDPARLAALAVPKLHAQLVPFYLAVIAAIMLIQHVIMPHTQGAVILMLVGGFVVLLPWLRADVAVYLGTAVAVPVAAILLENTGLAGVLLGVFGGGALVMMIADAFQAERVERERMYVVLILMFFSMLFWAFFEQAGSSVNNFTDRNVDRIIGGRRLTSTDVGQTLERLPVTSAFLGRTVAGVTWNRTMVDRAQSIARETVMSAPANATRDEITSLVNSASLKLIDQLAKPAEPAAGDPVPDADDASNQKATEPTHDDKSAGWNDHLQRAMLAKELHATLQSVTVTEDMVGMKVDGREVKASIFQATNPITILLLGLPLTMIWTFLARRRLEPNTAIKFSLGLLQLGLGFGAFWLGTKTCSSHGIVGVGWLLIGYMLHTTGELCLSPVGLSMVTRLSPVRMVSTVMGAWFLATAFSNYLAGLIAMLTGVGHEGGGESTIPLPLKTVHVYGDVFWQIAIAGTVSGVLLLILSPILVRWMHEDEPADTPNH